MASPGLAVTCRAAPRLAVRRNNSGKAQASEIQPELVVVIFAQQLAVHLWRHTKRVGYCKAECHWFIISFQTNTWLTQRLHELALLGFICRAFQIFDNKKSQFNLYNGHNKQSVMLKTFT